MYKYSIEKYNPAFRDSKRRYALDEWTAISDIGKVYLGVILDSESYIKTEDSYVNAIQCIIQYLGIDELNVRNVCKFKDLNLHNIRKDLRHLYTTDILKTYNNVKEGVCLKTRDICNLTRLQLREDIGALMFSPYRLKIFIGYDYLMGIHSSRNINTIISKIEKLGLYVSNYGKK